MPPASEIRNTQRREYARKRIKDAESEMGGIRPCLRRDRRAQSTNREDRSLSPNGQAPPGK